MAEGILHVEYACCLVPVDTVVCRFCASSLFSPNPRSRERESSTYPQICRGPCIYRVHPATSIFLAGPSSPLKAFRIWKQLAQEEMRWTMGLGRSLVCLVFVWQEVQLGPNEQRFMLEGLGQGVRYTVYVVAFKGDCRSRKASKVFSTGRTWH